MKTAARLARETFAAIQLAGFLIFALAVFMACPMSSKEEEAK